MKRSASTDLDGPRQLRNPADRPEHNVGGRAVSGSPQQAHVQLPQVTMPAAAAAPANNSLHSSDTHATAGAAASGPKPGGSGSQICTPAVAAAVPAGLSVIDLSSILQQQLGGDPQQVKSLVVPLRVLAKLLHGRTADLSTVRLAQLLPQLGVLLQYMQDRIGGRVQGKDRMLPSTALAHVGSLQLVLGLAEVRAELDEQQAAQLVEALQAAQQEFAALDRHQQAATDDAAGPAAAAAGQNQGAATALPSAGAALQPAGAAAPADAVPQPTDQNLRAAAPSFTVAQLLDALHSIGFCSQGIGRARTAVKKLLQLVHGTEADAGAVPACRLLQQWPVLHADLLQQVQGRSMKPRTASDVYAASMLTLLGMPQVHAQLGSSAVQQLQERVKADKAAFKQQDAGQQHAPGRGPAADQSAAAAAGQQRREQHKPRAGRARCTAAGGAATGSNAAGSGGGESESESAGNSSPVASAGDSQADGSQARQLTVAVIKERVAPGIVSALNGLAEAAGWDAGSRQGQLLSDLLQAQHVDTYLRRLRQRGCTEHHVKNVRGYLSSVLKRPDVQQCLGPDSVEQVQQLLKTAKQQPGTEVQQAAGAAAAAGTRSREPLAAPHSSGTAGAAPHSAAASSQQVPAATDMAAAPAGLSLAQLTAHCKRHKSRSLLDGLAPLRSMARIVHGSECATDSLQVAELLQHWGPFEQQVLQQLAGTHPTLPALSRSTAVQYTTRVMHLLGQPVLQDAMSADALQQLQQQVAASKAAFSSASTAGQQGSRPMPEPARRASTAAAEPRTTTRQQAAQALQPHTASPPATTAAGGHAAAAAQAAGPAGVAPPPTPAVGGQASALLAGLLQQVSRAAAAAAQAAPAGAAGPSGVAAGLSAAHPSGPAAGRSLVAAQRQLLALYTQQVQPAMADLRVFRAVMKVVSGLSPADTGFEEFWRDFEWVVLLSETPGSTREDFEDAFNTLATNLLQQQQQGQQGADAARAAA